MASTEIYRQKVNDLNARANRAGAKGRLNAQDLHAVLEYCGNHCQMPACTNTDVTFDHVIPLERGGLNARSNLGLLCESHNKGKSDDLVPDYRNGLICPDDFIPTKQAETYKKHDWTAIQFEYESTNASIRDLAKQFDMDASLIAKRSAAESWVKSKEKFAINLLSDVQQEARKKDVSSRVMILEAARIALEEWKENNVKSDLAQLAKILELAARVEGMELDKRSITVKDWRDAATSEVGTLESFADATAEEYFGIGDSGGDRESSAGWTD